MTSSTVCPTSPSWAARTVATLVASCVAVLGLAAVGSSAASAGTVGPAVSGTCAAVGLAGATQRAALIVDYGDVAGSPGRVDTYCVGVDGRTNGYQLLDAAGLSFRTNASGLVCAIGGFPREPECGDTTADGYRYWAYFRGGDAWSYRSVGPGSSYASDGVVEGWRFVQGKGNPTDPPPRHAPGFSTVCAAVPPTTTPTTAPPTTSAPTTAPRPGVPGAPTTVAPGAAPTTVAADGGTDATTDPAAGPAGTTSTGAAGPDGTGATTGTADGRVVGVGVDGAEDAAGAGATSTITDDDGGSSGAVAAGLGGVAVLGLGALALVRFRRPDEVDLP